MILDKKVHSVSLQLCVTQHGELAQINNEQKQSSGGVL